MTTHYEHPLWQLVVDHAEELGDQFRAKEMVDHFARHYPLFTSGSVRDQLRDMALNVDESVVPSIRPGFIERNAASRRLIRVKPGVYELYDPRKHGKSVKGRLLRGQ